MKKLTQYKGNFLEFADKEFDFRSQHKYTFDKVVSGLDISVFCDVAIFPSKVSSSFVEIDTDSVKDFRVYEKAGILYVEQEQKDSVISFVSDSGNSVVINRSGANVSIGGNKSNQNTYPHKIKIFCPQRIGIDAKLDGIGVLASKVIFDKAKIESSGTYDIGLCACSLKLDISGQGDSWVAIKGGSLEIELSGQGSFRAKGEYSEVDAEVSGMGNVFTEGTCSGNYRASVSGMGNITHSGSILGRVKQSRSGMGRINLS